jgi:hypothetical protein
MSKIQLLPEEMQQISMIQNSNREIMFKFGQIEMSIIQLQKAKNDLTNELEKSIEKEKQIAEQFRVKYGDGNIDLETGEFTPVE